MTGSYNFLERSAQKLLKKLLKINIFHKVEKHYSTVSHKLILVIIVTIRKNMNVFTIYVNQHKCIFNLLTGTDWNLESFC